MPFDKDKFITQARAGGIEENQAEFLAEQMDAKTVQPEDLQALENRLRSQLTDTADALRDEAEARAVLARVQMDDLTKDFSKMEARVEGSLRNSFVALQRALYASSAFNTLTTLSAVTFLLLWLD